MVVRSVSNLSGLALSLACVVHCILMPVCIASLPSWGLSWLASPMVHRVLAVGGIMIGLVTLLPGWKTHHRHSVLVFAACGLLVMNYSAFFGDDCCTIPAATTADAAGCCHDACCSKPETIPQPTQTSNLLEANRPLWGWLLQHPTVFGATCLAWAHCLNGRCSRRCCQSNLTDAEQGTHEVTLNTVNVPPQNV